jgi:glycosyltransferase involved in cell wall biosynthesis
MKFRVSIFSYRSYFTDKPRLQNNPSEWEIPIGSGTIYYSLNDREAVTNMELKNFITSNNIGIFIIPEICWKPIFDKTRYIKSLGVKVFAVPNIEIVIKKEIPEYGIFDKVLCNTKVCMDLLKKESSRLKLEYIGHGIDRMFPPNKTKLISGSIIEFVHVSGYNAIIRKQTHRILEAFQKLKNKNYHLKIFCQELPDELTRNIPDNTEIIAEKLPYRDVIRLYSECHISIQVSSHEGLGLGFYESIAQGTPVISLNTPPHNEVIINGVSGWLLPCTYGKLSDNKDAVIDEAFFKVEDLVTLIDHLLETPSEIDMVQNSTFKYYKDNWTTQTFTKRFVNSLIDP